MRTMFDIRTLILCAAVSLPLSSTAAQILEQSRGAATSIDGFDMAPPVVVNEQDAQLTSEFGGFSVTSNLSRPLNDNLAASTATHHTTIDPVSMRFRGSGNVSGYLRTNFTAEDAFNDAMISTRASNGMTVRFRLDSGGRVRLSLGLTSSLNSTAFIVGGPHAYVFIQTLDGTNVWWQSTSQGTLNFTGEATLKPGEYRLIVDVGHYLESNAGGMVVVDAQSSFVIDGAIIEGGKKGGKPR